MGQEPEVHAIRSENLPGAIARLVPMRMSDEYLEKT